MRFNCNFPTICVDPTLGRSVLDVIYGTNRLDVGRTLVVYDSLSNHLVLSSSSVATKAPQQNSSGDHNLRRQDLDCSRRAMFARRQSRNPHDRTLILESVSRIRGRPLMANGTDRGGLFRTAVCGTKGIGARMDIDLHTLCRPCLA